MKEMIELQLSEFDKNNMSDIKRDMLIDDLKGLDEIKQGEIKLNHVFCFPKDGGIELGCFLRNATEREVFLGDVCIKLIEKGEDIAQRTFSLNEKFDGVGVNKARYFNLFFPLQNEIEINEDDVELVWGKELEIGKIRDIKFSFIDELNAEKEIVKEFIKGLTPMREDDVKVDCFSLEKGESGSVEMLILVRNSCEKAISLKKIDIRVLQGDKLVAGGKFETEFIKLGPLEGKLYRFPIRKEHVYKEDADFEKCEVFIK